MEFLEKYQIEIYLDETYRSGSTDNLNTYNFEYFNETEQQHDAAESLAMKN